MRAKDAQKLKHYRAEKGKRKRFNEKVLDFDPAYIQSQLNPGTTNRRILTAFHHILNTVIEQELTPRQREIVLLYYFDGMTMREISVKLGVSLPSVSRTLHRGKNKIRSSLKYCILLLRTSIEEDDDDD